MGIINILKNLLSTRYGDDMRQYIHDGILECYNKAGLTIEGNGSGGQISFKNPEMDDEEMDDTYSTLRDEISAALDEAKAYANTVGGGRISYGSHYRVYVDCSKTPAESGDGTQNNPFATLDEAINLANKRGDLRVVLKTAGTYYLTKQLLVNTNMHMYAGTTGCCIRAVIPETEEWVVYSGHYKFNAYETDPELTFLAPICGATWNEDTNTWTGGVESPDLGYKFEHVDIQFFNVTFQCHVMLAHARVYANGFKFRTAFFSGVIGGIYRPGVLNTDPNKKAWRIGMGSQIRIKGQLTVSDLTSAGTGDGSVLLYITESDVVLSSSLAELTQKYYYALYISSTEISMTWRRWKFWQNYCVAGKVVTIGTNDISIVESDEVPNWDLYDPAIKDEIETTSEYTNPEEGDNNG